MNIEKYRTRLLAMEQQLVTRLAREGDTAREAGIGEGDAADLALVDEMKDESFATADADSTVLAQVREALHRIDAGTFGRCVIDGEPIEQARLDAVPWTPYCKRHQEEFEATKGVRTLSL